MAAVFGSTSGAYAQSRTIEGRVVSSVDNTPIIGAAVMVKGTSSGVSTSHDGSFSLALPAGANTLQVNMLGYVPREIDVAGRTNIEIALDEESTSLDDVVVIGYGVQKKKLTTGANLNVKGDELMKRNTSNALQALQGQTPGMQITATSGQPGESMKVTIRGVGTTNSNGSGPLFIIDGIAGDISKIPSSDIASIDVLKDAASAAIYGAQAANGVVLVTTKTGSKGRAQVYYDGFYGIQTVARKVKMLNAQDYMTIMDESALNSGDAPYDWSNLWDGTTDTNWVDKMFENAATQSHSVGITGGTDASVYNLSFSYSDQIGIAGGKDRSRNTSYTFRINTEHKLYGDILKVGQHLSYVNTDRTGIDVGDQYNNTLRGAYATSPLSPVYGTNNYHLGDEDGEWNDSTNSPWNNTDGNPYASMMMGRSLRKSQSVIGDVYAELAPVKGLKIRSTFGINAGTERYRSYTPAYQWSPYTYNADAVVSQSQSNGYSLSWINTASYQTTIADDHTIDAMIGSQWDTNDGESLYGRNYVTVSQYQSFDNAYLSNTTFDNLEKVSLSGSPYNPERTMSLFARVGYNYKEKYMINATFRADGSSLFAKGNRWGYFPSVSAGWVVTGEPWADDSNWLSFLKIRGSWGQVGNKNIGAFRYLASINQATSSDAFRYNFGTAMGTGALVQGAYPAQLANEDLKWETSEQLDFGFDARFFKDRLSVNFDWYRKTTKDWLVQPPIIATSGSVRGYEPYINGGDVVNTGVEFALQWNDNIAGSDFNYHIGVNGAYNKNKVGSIPTEGGKIDGRTNMLYDNSPTFYRAENGHSIGYWWGFETAGIFQTEQQIADWKAAGNGVYQANVQPGDVIFVDRNQDGVIDDKDKTDLGNGMPSFTYGFNVGFEWKGLDFSVTAYGAAGNKLVQSYRNHSNKQANYTTAVLDRWTGAGTSNSYPRVTNSNINWEFSDLYLQDGDYLRISNITLGYDFKRLIKGSWISQLRIYVAVQNAFTFTKYDGMDPEIGYGVDAWCSGVDVGYYPRPRTYMVGANIKF